MKGVPWYRRFQVYGEAIQDQGGSWHMVNIWEAFIAFLQARPIRLYGKILKTNREDHENQH